MCNGVALVPTCATWPPPWLTSSTLPPPAPSTEAPPPPAAEPPPILAEAPAVQVDTPRDRVPPGFTPDAVIVVADAEGHYPDDRRYSGPHMWTWIDAPTWVYTSDYPIPVSRKARL